MIILPDQQAVFVSQSRCCTETMYEALCTDYGGHRIGPNAHDNNVPWQYRHWYTFAIVRNPYDRAVSLWQWADEGSSFVDYCQWLFMSATSPLPQAQWLANVSLTMALPFERFPECLSWLPFWAVTAVPHRHKTEHRPWREYIGDKAREYILAWAHSDFEKFGYSRDPTTGS